MGKSSAFQQSLRFRTSDWVGRKFDEGFLRLEQALSRAVEPKPDEFAPGEFASGSGNVLDALLTTPSRWALLKDDGDGPRESDLPGAAETWQRPGFSKTPRSLVFDDADPENTCSGPGRRIVATVASAAHAAISPRGNKLKRSSMAWDGALEDDPGPPHRGISPPRGKENERHRVPCADSPDNSGEQETEASTSRVSPLRAQARFLVQSSRCSPVFRCSPVSPSSMRARGLLSPRHFGRQSAMKGVPALSAGSRGGVLPTIVKGAPRVRTSQASRQNWLEDQGARQTSTSWADKDEGAPFLVQGHCNSNTGAATMHWDGVIQPIAVYSASDRAKESAMCLTNALSSRSSFTSEGWLEHSPR